MVKKWQYLYVEVANNGRTIFENGVMVKGHTKKLDLSTLPKKLWNAKGREMTHEAKGDLINGYGQKGWEIVSTRFGEDYGNAYIFKRPI